MECFPTNIILYISDGRSGLSLNCIGDYSETWTPVPGVAKGFSDLIASVCYKVGYSKNQWCPSYLRSCNVCFLPHSRLN